MGGEHSPVGMSDCRNGKDLFTQERNVILTQLIHITDGHIKKAIQECHSQFVDEIISRYLFQNIHCSMGFLCK